MILHARPIFEVELLGMWAGMKIWGEKICDSFSVIYLDNEAAKGALLKGSSSTIQGNLLVDSILEMEEAFRTRAWFARVPTSANPADPPGAILAQAPFGSSCAKERWGGGGVVLALAVFSLVVCHGCVFTSMHALHGLVWLLSS